MSGPDLRRTPKPSGRPVPWQAAQVVIERRRWSGRRGTPHSPWTDRAIAVIGLALALPLGTSTHAVLSATDIDAAAALLRAPGAAMRAYVRWTERRDARWAKRDPAGSWASPLGLTGGPVASVLVRRQRHVARAVARLLSEAAPGATLRDLLRSPRWPAEVAGK